MYRGFVGRWALDEGSRPGVSRMSLCSSAQRPMGIKSESVNVVRRRSATVGRAVVEFGWEGMK